MTIGRPPNTLADVWRFVDRRGEDECWPYTGAKRRHGYGAFTIQRRTIPAHRAAFMASNGADPGDLLVCHRCDNPPCCNPAHLFLGTHTENVRDMLDKGRGRPPHGSRHHGAKLTEEKVVDLRSRYASGETNGSLATRFGISTGQVCLIVQRKNWRHVA